MKLSIIIVSYNTEKYILKCLGSIFKNLGSFDFEVIVVDNYSEDESVEKIKKQFPKVRLISLSRNIGFGGANNIAAKTAKGEYLVFLNADTLFLDDSFKQVVEFMDSDDKVGVVSPQVLLRDKKTIQPFSFGKEPTLFNLLAARLFSDSENNKIDLKQVGWVTGASLFIRADLFKKIGGFDKRYFMYFEDVDLCVSAKKLGYSVYLYPDSRLVHFGGKGLKNDQERKKIYWHSQKAFYEKHYGLAGWFFAFLLNLPRKVRSWRAEKSE